MVAGVRGGTGVEPDPGTVSSGTVSSGTVSSGSVASRGLDALRSLVLATLLGLDGPYGHRLLMAADVGVTSPTSDRDDYPGGSGDGGRVDEDHQFAASDLESAAE